VVRPVRYRRHLPDEAWEQIPFENDDFWTLFETSFNFRPSVNRFPGITEPTPSVTVDLAPVLTSGRVDVAAAEHAVNALSLLAMTRVFAPTEWLLVLDWQHDSWWFWPHQQAMRGDWQWPIEVFPNGDHYVFLNEGMTAGTFGHPWEPTLCVFGELAPVLAPMLAAWLPIKRSRP
jgi:hypothetical protein